MKGARELDLYSSTREEIRDIFEKYCEYRVNERQTKYENEYSYIINSPWEIQKIIFPSQYDAQLIFIYYCSDNKLQFQDVIDSNLGRSIGILAPKIKIDGILIFEDRGNFDYTIFSTKYIDIFLENIYLIELRFINFKQSVIFTDKNKIKRCRKYSFFNVDFSVIEKMRDNILYTSRLHIEDCYLTSDNMKLFDEYCTKSRQELIIWNIKTTEQLAIKNSIYMMHKMKIDRIISHVGYLTCDYCLIWIGRMAGCGLNFDAYSYLYNPYQYLFLYNIRELGIYDIGSDYELFLIIDCCITSEENNIVLLDFSNSKITLKNLRRQYGFEYQNYTDDEIWFINKVRMIPKLTTIVLKSTLIDDTTWNILSNELNHLTLIR